MNKFIRLLGLTAACIVMAGSDGCPFEWREAVEDGDEDVSELTWKHADHVIGQPSLDSGETFRPPAANTMKDPVGIAVTGDRLFVADSGNHRVLAYDGLPDQDNADADFALGQDSLDSNERGSGAGGLFLPSGVAAGSWGLAAADSDNDRVVLFDSLPQSGPRDADRVLGQPSLDEDLGPGCFDDALAEPWTVVEADERIFVSDYQNNRLMVWARDAASGSPAVQVIGQARSDSCRRNRGQAAPSGDSLNGPAGFWTDGSRLAVADRLNNRVLLWADFPTQGEPADVVLGQSDMESDQANADGLSRGLNDPTDVYWDGRRLFVADKGNHRVLVYAAWPLANHPSPDAVLGQPDLDTAEANNTGDGTSVNARALNAPEAVWSDQDQVLVSDTGNARVLIYSLSED